MCIRDSYYTCCMLTSSILFWDLTIILQNVWNDLISRTVCQKGWYKAPSGKFQTLVDDCLNRTNTQAQFVSCFTNRDTSINENAGFNLADVLIRYCRTRHSSTNIIADRLSAHEAGTQLVYNKYVENELNFRDKLDRRTSFLKLHVFLGQRRCGDFQLPRYLTVNCESVKLYFVPAGAGMVSHWLLHGCGVIVNVSKTNSCGSNMLPVDSFIISKTSGTYDVIQIYKYKSKITNILT